MHMLFYWARQHLQCSPQLEFGVLSLGVFDDAVVLTGKEEDFGCVHWPMAIHRQPGFLWAEERGDITGRSAAVILEELDPFWAHPSYHFRATVRLADALQVEQPVGLDSWNSLVQKPVA